MKYDVLIIGAGLAGCACARLLARGGLRVLAVDRADLSSKDKLCGGLLTPRAVRVFERLYGPQARSVYSCEHHEMRVLVAAHDRVIGDVSVVGTRRVDVDRYALAQAREAEATVLDRTRLAKVDIPRGVALLSTPEGEIEVEFGALVAADGAASATRGEACRQYEACMGPMAGRGPRFARPAAAEVLPSIEAYVKPSSQMLTGKYDARLHGYGWYIPCGEGGNIGFDGKPGTTRAQLRDALGRFAYEMGVEVDEGALRGAFIPSGGTVLLQLGGPGSGVAGGRRGAWPRPVYLIGDAAGLAAPATGEGIYFALRSAELLATSLLRGPASYRSLMAGEAASLARQYAMLDVLFNETLMEKSMSFSHASGVGPERMARFALKLFASF